MEKAIAAAKAKKKNNEIQKRKNDKQINQLLKNKTNGIIVEPTFVLVFSLIFIFSVFLLHLWGRFLR